MRKTLIYFASALTLLSCSNHKATESTNAAISEEIVLEEPNQMSSDIDQKQLSGPMAMKGMKGGSFQNAKTNLNAQISQQTKLIKTGNISIETNHIKSTLEYVKKTVSTLNGYLESENNSIAETYSNHHLKIRIPAQKFDMFLNALESKDYKITEKNITTEDVSIKYYDVESRLKTKRTYLEKYQNMVSVAKNVSELLEIQEQIRVLQEEIESTESIFRSMNSQINYSSITIQIHHSDSVITGNSFLNQISEAISIGFEKVKTLFFFLISIWPIYIIFFISFLSWKKFKKK